MCVYGVYVWRYWTEEEHQLPFKIMSTVSKCVHNMFLEFVTRGTRNELRVPKTDSVHICKYKHTHIHAHTHHIQRKNLCCVSGADHRRDRFDVLVPIILNGV